jgi:mRNA interferase MazF
MEGFVKGDIVVVPFPFSDLSYIKRRPALVLMNLPGPDVVLCQITSKNKSDSFSVSLSQSDFEVGQLNVESFIRPNRIFTAEKSIVLYKAGTIRKSKFLQVKNLLLSLLED